jgi:hypothetical protein
MRRTNIWMHTGHLAEMEALAKARGLKVAQLVRIAVQEYIRREARKK